MERRNADLLPVFLSHIGDTSTGTAGTLSGIAVPYGITTKIGKLTESIRHGAFAKVIGKIRNGIRKKIVALVNHDASSPIGEVSLEETEKGLAYTLPLLRNPQGLRIARLAERGELSGVSIGFSLDGSSYSEYDDVREIADVDLKEISILTQATSPAYPDTTISKRKKIDLKRWLGIKDALRARA